MNFLKKIFSPTVLTISFLLLIYTFYKSEIFWDGSKRDYYFIYYVISLILFFFSIITFFISQKIKEYLIISGMSLVVSLYIFEGYLIFKDQFSKEQLYEKQTGKKKWDKRSKLEIYEDLKKINNEIVLSVYPKYYLNKNYSIFPLSGVSNSKTINCNENGYYSIYISDRYGFNNPNDEWDSNEIEYLLVGDSFTHGACVNSPNDIASVLRTLSNKSVLNLGLGGNGSLIEYATLREYLNSNVKKVIWIYYEGNDLWNLNNELGDKNLNNYLKDLNFSQNLKSKQNEVDYLGRVKIKKEIKKIKKIAKENSKKFLKLRNFLKLTNLRGIINYYLPNKYKPEYNQYKPEYNPSEKTILEFKKILQLAKNLTIKNNSKLYFVYLPEYSFYKIKLDYARYSLVKNIVNELKIPFIDIHKEVFEKEQNPLKLFPFYLNGHYSVEGYKKVSENIYKFTKE